jgi:hypothetical protein
MKLSNHIFMNSKLLSTILSFRVTLHPTHTFVAVPILDQRGSQLWGLDPYPPLMSLLM